MKPKSFPHKYLQSTNMYALTLAMTHQIERKKVAKRKKNVR